MSESGTRRLGMRMVRSGLVAIGAFLIGAGAWLVFQSVRNPDVRLKRPRWIEDGAAFDHSFWTPVLLVIVVGAGLVSLVLWIAFRRMRSGEDLYANRLGKGLRRRGEVHLDDE